MKSIEQINKIESTLLYVLRNFKEGVDYIKLFKILYFAQREFLSTYGKVLIPDTFKARNWGPVPSLSDKIIKMAENKESVSNYPDLKGFSRAIKVVDKMVFAIKEPNLDYLSKKERECLDKWYNECKDKDSKNELSPASHDSAYKLAWSRYQKDPQQGILTFIEIARAGGASEKMIEYIREKELITAEFCDE